MIRFEREVDGNYTGVAMTLHNDASIDELVQEFKLFLLALGYHTDTVEDYFHECPKCDCELK